jgi:hypothetical protein
MREVVIDTETTGLDPHDGHRIVEIAGLELVHHVPTGRKFHCYVNPERDMPAEAMAVHGLDAEFLAGHQPFAAIADELTGFIAGDRRSSTMPSSISPLSNAELARVGRGRSPFRLSTRAVAPAVSGCAGEPRRAVPAFAIDLSLRDGGRRSIAACWRRFASSCSAERQPGLDFAASKFEDGAGMIGAAQASAAAGPPARALK